MIGYILLLLFLLFIVAILVAPLRLIVHTDHNIYRLSWAGLVRIALEPVRDDLQIVLTVLTWRKTWSVAGRLAAVPQKKQPADAADKTDQLPVKEKRRNMWRRRMSARRVVALLRSFRVRAWELNLDTGDYVTNAYWYPVFALFSRMGGRWRINYTGEIHLHADVSNSLARVLVAFIRPVRSEQVRFFNALNAIL